MAIFTKQNALTTNKTQPDPFDSRRGYEYDIDGYGTTNGSGGIKGRVLATDDLQELKMLASAALSGFARGTQDRQQTALGSTITGSVSNVGRTKFETGLIFVGQIESGR